MLFQIVRNSDLLGHILVMSVYGKGRWGSEKTQEIISIAWYWGESGSIISTTGVQKGLPYLLLRSLSPDF